MMFPPSAHEDALRDLMALLGRAKTLQGSISRLNAADSRGALYSNGNVYFAVQKPSRFKVETNTMWGDESSCVSDGRTFALNNYSGVYQLFDAKPDMMSNGFSLGPTGADYSPVWVMLKGPSALHDLIAPGAPGGVSASGFWFESKNSGRIDISFLDKSRSSVSFTLDIRSRAQRMAEYRMTPMFFDEPPRDPLDRQTIVISLNPALSGRLFDTRVPKGFQLSDQRAKKKPSL